MTTKNIVPRATGEGELGTSSKKWDKVQARTGSFDHIQTTTMATEIYTSGSTKFGDTSDDTHQFTGSVLVDGDLTATTLYGDGQHLTNVTTDTELTAEALTRSTNDALLQNGINANTIAIGNLDLDAITTVGNTTTNNISVTDLTVTEITASGILSSSAQVYVPKINLNNNETNNYISYNNGFFYNGDGHFYGNLTSSVFSASSGFVGDGSGLTNLPAASWDGQLNGDAGITGSLDVSGSTEFGNLSTDTHQFTGSFLLRNPDETNAGLLIEAGNTNHVTIKTTDEGNGRINIGSGLNSTLLITSNFAGSMYPASDTYDFGNSSKPWNSIGTKRLTASLGIEVGGQVHGSGNDIGEETSVNFDIDWDSGMTHELILSGAAATTLTASFVNVRPYATYQLIHKIGKDNMAIYFSDSIYWPGGTRPTLSTTSGSVDVLTFTTDGNSNLYGVAQYNFSASVG